jgi:hypothetical protein
MLDNMVDNANIQLNGQDVACVKTDHDRLILVVSQGVSGEIKGKIESIFSKVDLGVEDSRMKNLAEAYRSKGFIVTEGEEIPFTQGSEVSPKLSREASFIHESDLMAGVENTSYKEILESLMENEVGGHVSAWRFIQALAEVKIPLELNHIEKIKLFLIDENGETSMEAKQFLIDLRTGMQSLPPEGLEKILRFAAEKYESCPESDGRVKRLIVNYILAYFNYPPFTFKEVEAPTSLQDYFVSQYERPNSADR